MNSRIFKIAVIFLVLGMAIGFTAGYIKGIGDMSQWVAEKIVFFTEVRDGKVLIDADMLATAIINYKSDIDICFEDALIYDNTGD